MRSIVLLALAALAAGTASWPAPARAFQDGIFDCASTEAPCAPAGQSFESCASLGCHGGLLPRDTTTRAFLEGLPVESGYVPGESRLLTVRVVGVAIPIPVTGCPSPIPVYNGLNAFYGFNLAADAGRLSAVEPGERAIRIRNETECARLRRLTGCGPAFAPPCPECDDETIVDTQATHTLEGNQRLEWSVVWTAPDPGAGDVRFRLAGNAVNGNCRPDPGDLPGVMPGITVPQKPGT